MVKNPPANTRDMGSSPGLGRSHMPRNNKQINKINKFLKTPKQIIIILILICTSKYRSRCLSIVSCFLLRLYNFFFFYKFIYFIYFWLRWVFVAARGLSLVAASGGCSSLCAWASHCGGLSCCGAQALEHRLSSCGARA